LSYVGIGISHIEILGSAIKVIVMLCNSLQLNATEIKETCKIYLDNPYITVTLDHA